MEGERGFGQLRVLDFRLKLGASNNVQKVIERNICEAAATPEGFCHGRCTSKHLLYILYCISMFDCSCLSAFFVYVQRSFNRRVVQTTFK